MKEKKIFDIEKVGFGDEIGFRIPPKREPISKPKPEPRPEIKKQVENSQKREVVKEVKKAPPQQPPRPKKEPVPPMNRNLSPRKPRFLAEEFISPITGSKPKKPQVVHVAYGEYKLKAGSQEESQLPEYLNSMDSMEYPFQGTDESLGNASQHEVEEKANNEILLEENPYSESEKPHIQEEPPVVVEIFGNMEIPLEENLTSEEEEEHQEVTILSEEEEEHQEATSPSEEEEEYQEAIILSEEEGEHQEVTLLSEEEEEHQEATLLSEEEEEHQEATLLSEEEEELQEAIILSEEEEEHQETIFLSEEEEELQEKIILSEEKEENQGESRIHIPEAQTNLKSHNLFTVKSTPSANEEKLNIDFIPNKQLEEAKELLNNVETKFFSEKIEENQEEPKVEETLTQAHIVNESMEEVPLFGEAGGVHDVDGILDILDNEGTVHSLIESLLLEDGLTVDGHQSDLEYVSSEMPVEVAPEPELIEEVIDEEETEAIFDGEEIFYYETPSIELLEEPVMKEEQSEDWIVEKMEILEHTFNSFGVKVGLTGDYTQGPTITQIEIKPESGTKMSKILGLINDLKLNLSVEELRIEPIPGKNTIGIEVPNPSRRLVKIKEVLSRPEFVLHESPLCVALGEDIAGNPVYIDILKMPHGLIAGQTGSGKSVCINTLLISILYKASPEDVRLMLIDPKRVELAPYNKIPHLVTPVITDENKAANGLKWAVNEMERRYELFERNGVRDINSFNNRRHDFELDYPKMPYILIIIDELADLMMVSAQEVEDHIMRITQKARAAGIHLIVATQRPTVDVITGTVKSNIPSRIAFAVAQANDSRVILDENGAQNLLGYGDLLLSQSGSKLKRVQCSYITDGEIERVVGKVRQQGMPKYLIEDQYFEKTTLDTTTDEEPLIRPAMEYFLERGVISASSLQTKMRIGFNRATRIIETLEQQGMISEPQGASRKREIKISSEELEILFTDTKG